MIGGASKKFWVFFCLKESNSTQKAFFYKYLQTLTGRTSLLNHSHGIFVCQHLEFLETLRYSLVHFQVFFHAVQRALFLKQTKTTTLHSTVERCAKCVMELTSVGFTLLAVKSVTQSAKQSSESLLYDRRKSENWPWKVV